MINEALYRAMTALFSTTPRIVNEGVVASINLPPPAVSYLPCTTIINARDIVGGEQYTVNCPFCSDTRSRLYISAVWGAELKVAGQTYVCSKRLMRCFNEDCQKVPSNREWLTNRLTELLGDPVVLESTDIRQCSSEVNVSEAADQVPLPPHMADIEHPSVPEYIRKYWYTVRGFSADTLRKFSVKIAYMPYPIQRGAGMMEQPVTIIPVFQYGNYWFYQARLIPVNGDPNLGYERNQLNDEFPKYYIPRGAKKNWALYNLDRAQKYEEIAIVEGPTDVWRIGDRAVAKFGRTLSPTQRSVLSRLFKGKSLILVPDMDDPQALPEAEKDMTILQNLGVFKNVRISVMDNGKDPGSLCMGEDEIWQYIQEHTSLPGDLLDTISGSLVKW